MQITRNFGTAGQPSADQFPIIAGNGYRHVMNIGMPGHADALANEGELVSALGMNYIHIPVPFDNPSPDQVGLFCKMLSQISHEKVFIHCIMNYRVSAFMYHYLSKMENRDDNSARSVMFQKWDMDPVWKDLMTWSSSDLGL
ncbi:MAG: phosphatase [Gammaproteobacteria bacterium]|nr:phosphatase [Gammaproteobacteria bacterium]